MDKLVNGNLREFLRNKECVFIVVGDQYSGEPFFQVCLHVEALGWNDNQQSAVFTAL